jgi:hypothetical protein
MFLEAASRYEQLNTEADCRIDSTLQRFGVIGTTIAHRAVVFDIEELHDQVVFGWELLGTEFSNRIEPNRG